MPNFTETAVERYVVDFPKAHIPVAVPALLKIQTQHLLERLHLSPSEQLQIVPDFLRIIVTEPAVRLQFPVHDKVKGVGPAQRLRPLP